MTEHNEGTTPAGGVPHDKTDNQQVGAEELERHLNEQFTATEIEQLEAGAVEFEELGRGLVLDRWFALVPTLQLLRTRAMHAARASRPMGWYFNAIWGGFIVRFYPSLSSAQSKKQLQSLLWVTNPDHPERMQLWTEHRNSLPAHALLHLNTPKGVENALRRITKKREEPPLDPEEPGAEIVPNWVKQESRNIQGAVNYVSDAPVERITDLLLRGGFTKARDTALETLVSLSARSPDVMEPVAPVVLGMARDLLFLRAQGADSVTARKIAVAIRIIDGLFVTTPTQMEFPEDEMETTPEAVPETGSEALPAEGSAPIPRTIMAKVDEDED